MRLALGERGAMLIAAGIAVSTLGFLSQGMLTAPPPPEKNAILGHRVVDARHGNDESEQGVNGA
jgi:hypothetical protein